MPNDVYQLTIYVDVPRAGVISNIMHYQAPDDSATNPYEVAMDILMGWDSNNRANYKQCLSDDCTFAAESCKRMYSGGGPTATNVVNQVGGHADAIADSAIAANCQLIVDGPPYKPGHQFFGGIPFSAITGNVIAAPFRTLLTTYLTELILPIIGTLPGLPSYQFGVWDKKTHVLRPVVATQIAPKPTALNKRLGPYI